MKAKLAATFTGSAVFRIERTADSQRLVSALPEEPRWRAGNQVV
jgi:hypothetical protein